ncbi:MAG: hypothetical protein HY482_00600 [Candidatus Wildermuthbacteria bacterium]|nr:hypothetical protein [Candidatus Wildermuthbacteria bacterium]
MIFKHLFFIGWAPALVLLAQGAVVSWTHLYWTFPWLDIPAHFLGGASIAIAGGNAIASLNAAGRVPFLPRFFSAVCVFSFVALAAVGWEWFEFLGDYLLGTNMQATTQDTMADFLFGLLGGACVLILQSMYFKRRVS